MEDCMSLSPLDYLRLFIVKPPLTDTSRWRTSLVSGHLVKFSGTYKHYIFNLS